MTKETVGEYLKRERELRQITLNEVSEGTKISVRQLKFIEENKFDCLPAEVFVRGFIRSYAEYIGLDPQEAILKLEEYLKDQSIQDNQHEIPSAQFDLEHKRAPRPVIIVIVLILAILIGLGIYYFSAKKDTNILFFNNPVNNASKEKVNNQEKENENTDLLLKQNFEQKENSLETKLSNNSTN